MTPRSSLLRAMILAAATTPALGCGGKTDDTTGEASAQGQGGSAGSGGSGQGGAGTAGSSGSSGHAGSAPAPWPCVDPAPVVVDGKPTGYERCADGSLRRTEVVDCPSLVPRSTTCAGSASSECSKDADCKAKPDGYCHVFGFAGGDSNDYCGCSYGCVRDSDCNDGQICQCGDPVGHCVQATCTSNAGCPEGDCASFGFDEPCTAYGFACLSKADTCGGNADCPIMNANIACVFDGTSRSCRNATTCVPGRPLFVDQSSRQAALVVAAAGWG